MNEYEDITVKEQPSKKSAVIQIIFLILLALAIGCMISAIITVKNYAEILKNPLGYNMEKFDLAYCTCYDTNNRIVPIQSKLFNESYQKYLPIAEFKETNFADQLNLSLIKIN